MTIATGLDSRQSTPHPNLEIVPMFPEGLKYHSPQTDEVRGNSFYILYSVIHEPSRPELLIRA